MRALVLLRVVHEHDDGRFALAPRGERLRSDAPDSLRALALAPAQPWWWRSWGRLADAIRLGTSGFEVQHGHPIYRLLEDDPEAAAIYGEFMGVFRADELAEVAATYDFGAARVVVDVGGGSGALLEAVLRRHAHLRGVLLDVEAMVSAAASRLATAGLADRVQLVAGDFFEGVPPGGDVYVLRQVVHDWDDERARAVLARVREVIDGDGRLLLVQHVLTEAERPSRSAFIDIALLVLTGGRERTLEEYRALLASAGFTLTGTQATRSGATLLEAST